jgi:trehalose synthase
MLQNVDIGERSLASYEGIVPDEILEHLRDLAADLRGLRILHVNATPYGGGVSELLRSLVPLINDLGLVADWKIIRGDKPFFDVTKKIHNGLQGAELELTPEEKAHYEKINNENARDLTEEYDVVFLHDPQPAAILPLRGNGQSRWVWRCHIDTGQPNPAVWEYIRSFLAPYDAAIFTMQDFVPPDFPISKVQIIPPAIDPLSPKNMPIADTTVRQVLDWIGVRLNRPLITQVSRFDPWKDPLGMIEVYKRVREEMPDLQLALVGSMALDDPEGWEIYKQVQSASQEEPLIHVFTNLSGVGNIEVNAFQRHSELIVQKSIREGFGLVVSESLWKGTPVVGGRAGGIPLQMSDDSGGLLVDSIEECADAVLRLLKDPVTSKELGERGRERVREHFLLPRLLVNELSLVKDLMSDGHDGPIFMPDRQDPVCGLALPRGQATVRTTYEGTEYVFCSEVCKQRFLLSPERYLSTFHRS